MPPRLARSHCLMILTLVVLLIYGRTLTHSFLLWDDPGHLTENPFLHPPGWASIARFWSSAYNYLYIPVTYTVWTALAWIAAQLAGSGQPATAWNAGIFHGANVVLHVTNSWLVFRILELMLAPPQSPQGAKSTRRASLTNKSTGDGFPAAVWPALGGALFFAAHPLQIEPVAWVAGLRDLLATALALGAMLRWLRLGRVFSLGSYLGASALFALALLSKPSVVVVPAMLIVIDRWITRRRAPWAMASMIPWLLADLLAVLATKAQQGDSKLVFITPLWLRPAVALDALAFYAAKIFVPFGLSADYAWTASSRISAVSFWPSAALASAGIAIAIYYRQRAPFIFGGILLVILGFFPILGFVPFEFQNFSTVADRFAYLPLVGGAFLFALAVRRWPAALGLAALWLALSLGRIPVWKNDETLFADTLVRNPASFMAHNNLGLRYYHQGKLEDALTHYREALRISPHHPPAQDNIGVALARLERYSELIAHYRAVLKERDTSPTLHADLGAALIMMGQADEGIAECRRALALDPALTPASLNLAKTLIRLGQRTEARSVLERAIERDATTAELRTLLEQVRGP